MLRTLIFTVVAEGRFLQNAKLPNIIFILADDLGYGDTMQASNITSSTRIPTPNMQRMASKGMQLTHFYTSPVCTPTRCSLMTGRHTGHCSVRGNGGLYTPIKDTTVAKLLQKTHTTALIGKWGLGSRENGGHPLQHGFDYFFGQLGDMQAFRWYPYQIDRQNESVVLNDMDIPASACMAGGCQWVNDVYRDEAIRFIRNSAAQHKPFFLYLAPTTPHWAKLPDVDLHFPTPSRYFDYEIINPKWPRDAQGFAAAVLAQDHMLGLMLDEVETLNIARDTLILFCGDNGMDLHRRSNFPFNDNGPLRGFKESLHEGGVRQVLLAQWQGMISPGSVSHYNFAVWDFLPTVSEIIGMPSSSLPQHDGVSLAATLMGKGRQQHHEHLYWEHCSGFPDENSYAPGWVQAVRVDKWKGIRVNKDSFFLYDLDTDMGEQHNVAKQYPEVVTNLLRAMQDRTENEAWPSSTSELKCCQLCESSDDYCNLRGNQYCPGYNGSSLKRS